MPHSDGSPSLLSCLYFNVMLTTKRNVTEQDREMEEKEGRNYCYMDE